FEGKGIKICKLHGSIHWRLGKYPSRHHLVWTPMNFNKGLVKKEMYFTDELLSFEAWNRYRPLGEVDPFLVLPGFGKAFDVRSVSFLWYKPEIVFAFTHNIYIIGLSLADDDFFIRSFFLANLPYIESFTGISGRQITIINPSPDAEKNYYFVLRKKIVTLIQERFAVSHIEQMKF
ncbi:MAG: hypothetical protein K8I82_01330, partial [Anaerolineae bacterium]|nr:hypothetical protein [Anaerolineae bacterium]